MAFYCEKCGNELLAKSEFCNKCGNEINSDQKKMPSNTQRNMGSNMMGSNMMGFHMSMPIMILMMFIGLIFMVLMVSIMGTIGLSFGSR